MDSASDHHLPEHGGEEVPEVDNDEKIILSEPRRAN